MKTQIARATALLENCGECGGSGYVPCEPDGEPDGCSACKITGKTPIDLPSHLMIIVGSLVDASRAFEAGERARWALILGSHGYGESENQYNDRLYYELFLQNTADDYLSAAMVGLMQIADDEINIEWGDDFSRGLRDNTILRLIQFVVSIGFKEDRASEIDNIFKTAYSLATHHKIDLDRHIDAYLSYKEGER